MEEVTCYLCRRKAEQQDEGLILEVSCDTCRRYRVNQYFLRTVRPTTEEGAELSLIVAEHFMKHGKPLVLSGRDDWKQLLTRM